MKCLKHKKTEFKNAYSKQPKIGVPKISLNISMLTEALDLRLFTILSPKCQAKVHSGSNIICYLVINVHPFEN